MFKPGDFPRSEWTEPVTADAPLEDDEVELIFDEPTFDDLAELFEELDNQIEIEEERAENRVDNLKSHKANLYGKCI